MASYLLDTNLLLRSSDSGSPSRSIARQATDRLISKGHQVFVTAQNLVEYWAVATRPILANGLGWSLDRVSREVNLITAHLPLLEETPDILQNWLALVRARGIKGKQVHDARLVAVMLTHGVTHLLTFNTDDFKSHPDIFVIHPGDLEFGDREF